MKMREPERLEQLGELLKDTRRAQKRTARDVAAAAGITPTYLWMLETGINPKTGKPSRPSVNVLSKLAETLQLQSSALFALAGYTALEEVETTGAPTPSRDAAPRPVPFDEWRLSAPEHLVGRRAEMEWALARLRVGGMAGIVVLRGLGGVGKTALAGAIARQLHVEGGFPDGIAVVLCKGVTDGADILRRVLARFESASRQLRASDPTDLAEAAVRLLSGKNALVVLDGIEPDLPVAEVVGPLRGAGVALLLTARQRLTITGLPVEADRALDLLADEEALDLFAQALGRENAAGLTPDEEQAARRIVGILGRHTLAVQRAGTHAADTRRHLETLAGELERWRQSMLLAEGNVLREVEVALLESVDALPLDARRLFAAMAVFPGDTFGRQAVYALGAGLGLDDPGACTDLLVVRGLVNAGTSATMPANSDRERLGLHPLLRALAAAQQGAWPEDERERATRAVALHYASAARQLAGESRNADEANRALHPDEDNIAAALTWAHERQERELVVALCVGMQSYWRDRAQTKMSLHFLPWGVAAAISLLGKRPDAGAGDAATADALADWKRRADDLFWLHHYLGYAFQASGELEKAQRRYDRCRRLAEEAGARRNEGAALSQQAQIWHARGRLPEAEDNLRQSLAIRREVGDRQGEVLDLRLLSQVAQQRGELETAERYLEESLKLAREMGDRWGEGSSLAQLGRLARDRGQLDAAKRQLSEALVIAREVHHRLCEGTVLRHLGRVARDRGWLDDADSYFQQSFEIADEVQDRRGAGTVLAQRGRLAHLRGRLDEAEALLRGALGIAREVQDRQGEGLDLGELGLIAQSRGQLEVAQRYYEQAREIAQEVQDRRGEGRALSRLGQVAQLDGRIEEAEDFHGRALAIHKEVQDRRGEGIDLAQLGQVALLRGMPDQAETLLRQSLEIAREVLDPRSEGFVLSQLGWLMHGRGNLNAAEHFYRQSIAILRAAQDRRGVGAVLSQLGWLAQARGQWDEADGNYRQSLEIARDLGDRRTEGAVLSQLGWLAQARGLWDDAERLYRQSVALRREVRDRRGEATDLARLGRMAQLRNNLAEAERAFEQALELDVQIENRRGEGIDLSRLGQVAQARGELDQAEGYFQQSLAIRREIQDRRGEAEAYFDLAGLALALQDPVHTEEWYRKCLAIRRDLGSGADLAETLMALGRFLLQRHGREDEGRALLREARDRYAEMDLHDMEHDERHDAEYEAEHDERRDHYEENEQQLALHAGPR